MAGYQPGWIWVLVAPIVSRLPTLSNAYGKTRCPLLQIQEEHMHDANNSGK